MPPTSASLTASSAECYVRSTSRGHTQATPSTTSLSQASSFTTSLTTGAWPPFCWLLLALTSSSLSSTTCSLEVCPNRCFARVLGGALPVHLTAPACPEVVGQLQGNFAPMGHLMHVEELLSGSLRDVFSDHGRPPLLLLSFSPILEMSEEGTRLAACCCKAQPRCGDPGCDPFRILRSDDGSVMEDWHGMVLRRYGITELSVRNVVVSSLRDRVHSAMGLSECEYAGTPPASAGATRKDPVCALELFCKFLTCSTPAQHFCSATSSIRGRGCRFSSLMRSCCTSRMRSEHWPKRAGRRSSTLPPGPRRRSTRRRRSSGRVGVSAWMGNSSSRCIRYRALHHFHTLRPRRSEVRRCPSRGGSAQSRVLRWSSNSRRSLAARLLKLRPRCRWHFCAPTKTWASHGWSAPLDAAAPPSR